MEREYVTQARFVLFTERQKPSKAADSGVSGTLATGRETKCNLAIFSFGVSLVTKKTINIFHICSHYERVVCYAVFSEYLVHSNPTVSVLL